MPVGFFLPAAWALWFVFFCVGRFPIINRRLRNLGPQMSQGFTADNHPAVNVDRSGIPQSHSQLSMGTVLPGAPQGLINLVML
ncbi:hypothetical protein DPEC_G00224670 [Dallia pectoralis]|uniref:Uncharacterized protein n=1 Tax=Dallia pectoralis TaxID=75939 RepID=A0ACC2FZX4_DALPE|nr:hypothetical protein DPEC_G00224670 [Dallia pectoralis]